MQDPSKRVEPTFLQAKSKLGRQASTARHSTTQHRRAKHRKAKHSPGGNYPAKPNHSNTRREFYTRTFDQDSVILWFISWFLFGGGDISAFCTRQLRISHTIVPVVSLSGPADGRYMTVADYSHTTVVPLPNLTDNRQETVDTRWRNEGSRPSSVQPVKYQVLPYVVPTVALISNKSVSLKASQVS